MGMPTSDYWQRDAERRKRLVQEQVAKKEEKTRQDIAQAQRLYAKALIELEEDKTTFPVDADTFKDLCDQGNYLEASDTRGATSVAARALVACRDFPLRRTGNRLLVWNGVFWSDQLSAVQQTFRLWCKGVAGQAKAG